MILQKGWYIMKNLETIKGYKELKAERSQFKQKALEEVNKILDDIDDVANIEECFEIRTELEAVYLMCNMSDNRITILINNTNLDFALIELDKDETIKDIAIISPEDAAKKINQFIHQNCPSVATESYTCPEGVLNKLQKFYDNTSLIICHKNILIQIIDELIAAESLKTNAIKELVIESLKRKMHSRIIKIDELELHQISEEKQLREYASWWDLDSINELLEKINYQKDVINIIIQYKEDSLKISRMKNIDPVYPIEKLERLLYDANDRLIEVENEIDKLYNKLMK